MMNGVLTEAPPSSIAMLFNSGFINCDIFVNWLHHFQSHVRSFKENLCLLILDNHASHVTLVAIEFCRKHHITYFHCHPHSSHKAQPLDLSFLDLLTDYILLNATTRCTYNKSTDIKHVNRIFYKAYTKAATTSNSVKGFEVTGIPLIKLFL